jgi:insulin receptor
VDIRNSVDAFQRLSKCRVVEGFVQIVLIDHATESSFSNLSFPNLREITHYLLLYRVNGLRSLGRLFPNLAVIRGETLFLNYALVVFEMIHLQVTVVLAWLHSVRSSRQTLGWIALP